MKSIEQSYMEKMTSLQQLTVPKAHKVVVSLLIATVLLTLTFLWFTPWVQTAQGNGEVNTLNPKDRIQAISALVSGKIQTWHVREGQKVKAGDPIVTLADTDIALVERLNAQLSATQRRHQANQLAVSQVQSNLNRQTDLLAQGLVSEKNVEKAEIKVQDLLAKAAATEAELSVLSVSLARQSIQTKIAPQDGTILRLLSAGNATFVKPGDVLASFIPDGVERSVVLKVTGLDAPLVQAGHKVRLQFDGWPVFQFSGWPGTAVGTFGGIVEFIEPIADQRGHFNIWIKQDLSEHPWPDKKYVRLGSRVKGWVLLEEVQLGYEIWRQLNNFPPLQVNRAKSTANEN
ncbi:MAG: HlyD family efflux transporter periplasmic adaptor subunit [Colwellia sp.]|nr:HlyD family efflux transporter periplasmic adaptor subunit [Colwellia sp.]